MSLAGTVSVAGTVFRVGLVPFLLSWSVLPFLLGRFDSLCWAIPASPWKWGYALWLFIFVPLTIAAGGLFDSYLCRRAEVTPPRGNGLLKRLTTILALIIPLMTLATPVAPAFVRLQGAFFLLGLLLLLIVLLRTSSVALGSAAISPPALTLVVTMGVPLFFYLSLFSWQSATSSTTGDEPYYLMVAGSIARDQDTVLDNQFRPSFWKSFYWKENLAPQNMSRTAAGLRSTSYSTLFPLLLAPASLIHSRWGPSITVILISSLLAGQIFVYCRELGLDKESALFSWAIASFSLPLAAFSTQIYPETTAALMVVLILRALSPCSSQADKRGSMAVGILGCIALPLLKVRYLPLSLAAFLAAAAKDHRRRWLLFMELLALGGGAFLLVDRFLFHGGLVLTRFPSFSLVFKTRKFFRFATAAALGLCSDQEFGILPYAPLYLLFPAGVLLAVRRRGADALLPMLPAAFYLVVLIGHFGHLWYGGFSQPGRYAVVLIPFLAPYMAETWRRDTKPVVAPLALAGAVWGAAVFIPYFLSPSFRYNNADGLNNILQAAGSRLGLEATSFFPSFINAETIGLGVALSVLLVVFLPAGAILYAARLQKSGHRAAAYLPLLALAAGMAFCAWQASSRSAKILEAESAQRRGGSLFTGYGRGPVVVFSSQGELSWSLSPSAQSRRLTISAGAKRIGSQPFLTLFQEGHEILNIALEADRDRYRRHDYEAIIGPVRDKSRLRLTVGFADSSSPSLVFIDRLRLEIHDADQAKP